MSEHEDRGKQIALIGKRAAMSARDSLLQELSSRNLGMEALAIHADELLNAYTVKTQWNAKKMMWEYSKPLTDNVTRFNTLKLLMDFNDVMPSKKLDINDKRQTRELASMLFAKLEQLGQLGADDKALPCEVGEGEMALMGEQLAARRKGEGEVIDVGPRRVASLVDFSDEEE